MDGDQGDGTTFAIAGGVGSISYTMAEISKIGGTLGGLAESMVPLVDRMQSEWFWLDSASAGAVPYPQGPLDSLLHAIWRARRVQADTAALAGRAGRAAANYAAAEAANAAAVTQAKKLAALNKGLNNWQLGPLAPLGTAAEVAALLRTPGMGLRDLVEKVLNDGGAYAAGTLGPGLALMYLLSQLRRHEGGSPGSKSPYMLRKFFDSMGVTRPGHMVVRAVPAREWDLNRRYYPPGHASSVDGEPWRMRASIQGLLEGSRDAYGYPPGSIGIVRVERPDGSNAWIVHLPGTEDWSTIDSTNPFDMEGNVEGLTAAQNEKFKQHAVLIQELIKEALQASGALPGEDVILTGHSGGGIHAAAAVADPAFLADVNVKMIVIAGSPARNMDVPGGVDVLDLQNEHDIVTAADYGPPPEAPNWVTVTSTRPPTPVGASGGNVVGEGHSLDNYLNDAAELDRSDDPSVAASRDILRNVLGAGIAGAAVTGTKWVYQGRDEQDKTKVDKGKAVKGGNGTGRDRYGQGAR